MRSCSASRPASRCWCASRAGRWPDRRGSRARCSAERCACRGRTPAARARAPWRRSPSMPDGFILTVIKALVLVNLLMGFFGLMTVIERKLIGRMQTRYGPNRIGPYGMLQFIPDLGKLLQKQNVVPYGAHRRLYLAAPFISLFAAISAFAVILFGGTATVPGTDWQLDLFIGDSNVGVL